MDNYPIKSVAFGGFDKQDVIAYIERLVSQATERQNTLQAEIDQLRSKEASLFKEVQTLQTQLEDATAQCSQLKTKLAEETTARQALEPLKEIEPEYNKLLTEVTALRPDAEAYAQFRERLGSIECESRKRVADMEHVAAKQMQLTVDRFREQYQILMSTFETTASYVTGELRKVEVNLTQLPRAMDQAGSELNVLAAQLQSEEH